MNVKQQIFAGIFILITMAVNAQPFAKWTNDTLYLKNSKIERVIVLGDEIYTEKFFMQSLPINYVRVNHAVPVLDKNFPDFGSSSQAGIIQGANSEEFYFLLNDKPFTNKSSWKVQKIFKAEDSEGGSGATIILKGDGEDITNLELSLTYMLYPELPVIRKKLCFRNLGKDELKLEAVDVERLSIPWAEPNNVVSAEYGRQKRLGLYEGGANDPVVASHDVPLRRGFILGNEAPGILKRTTVCLDMSTLTIGLTHPKQDYGFREWLKPNETWESPWVFTCLYNNTDDPYTAIDTYVNDFVRKHMGIRLANIKEKPVFVYNTWNPFRGDINEKMIKEVALAASQCGIEEFIIDAGWYKTATGWKDPNDNWFNECGDWLVDDEKFPDGLKSVFDYIKSLGMKPGLWISLGQASLHSEVYQKHPEYWTLHEDGSNMFLHTTQDDMKNASGCFSSDYPKYIKDVILKYINEYGLEYAKLDLALVTSPYHTDIKRSGCYAKNHHHKDREESLLMNFRGLFNMFDQLHQEAPQLFIDCTFETMGGLQLIDYAMCEHAEGNWISNFEESTPYGSMRVRNLAWWRSPAIPAASMVIGNPRLDDPNPVLFLKSLAGSLPIMLGDPRKLSIEKRAELKQWADWMRKEQNTHDYMLYRQDLAGFSEPKEGYWDGFQRINTDTKSGGIVGIFRQGAKEPQRQVFVKYLDPVKIYTVSQAPDGKVVAQMKGKDLAEKGFKVRMEKEYDGMLFSVE